MRYLSIIVLSLLAIAAKANLPEPLNSYKNTYISCINVIVDQTLKANQEVTESLLSTSCSNELASLKAVIPENMKAGFLEQPRGAVVSNAHNQQASSPQ